MKIKNKVIKEVHTKSKHNYVRYFLILITGFLLNILIKQGVFLHTTTLNTLTTKAIIPNNWIEYRDPSGVFTFKYPPEGYDDLLKINQGIVLRRNEGNTYSTIWNFQKLENQSLLKNTLLLSIAGAINPKKDLFNGNKLHINNRKAVIFDFIELNEHKRIMLVKNNKDVYMFSFDPHGFSDGFGPNQDHMGITYKILSTLKFL